MQKGVSPGLGPRLVDGDFVNGIAEGLNRNYASGIVAHAGGGQANAFQLPAGVNFLEVDTVANADDSVMLPAAEAGVELTIFNSTANSANVFAQAGTDVINRLANNAAIAVASGATLRFICAKDGQWSAA